jgi:tellurite resistance protein TerC
LRLHTQRETVAPVSTSIWFWIAFHIGVFVALAVDLFQFKKRDRALSMRAAAQRTGIWIVLSLAFNLVVLRLKGPDSALDFLTGYLIEYSLSVDNIFLFVLIFAYFNVPPISQHRVLVWGIVGALVMRGIMIWLGVTLVERFHFIIYIFGLFLLITGVRMGFSKQQTDFGESRLLKMCRKLLPVTEDFRDGDFTARIDGRFMLTPLALVLLVIDVMDLVFAVDSIPAVFAITTDTFIVYTSNICAILGLRSLYFLLANLMNRFIYLRPGLAIILGFVGLKMILSRHVPIPNYLSLLVIVIVLAVTISLSMLATRNHARAGRSR